LAVATIKCARDIKKKTATLLPVTTSTLIRKQLRATVTILVKCHYSSFVIVNLKTTSISALCGANMTLVVRPDAFFCTSIVLFKE